MKALAPVSALSSSLVRRLAVPHAAVATAGEDPARRGKLAAPLAQAFREEADRRSGQGGRSLRPRADRRGELARESGEHRAVAMASLDALVHGKQLCLE